MVDDAVPPAPGRLPQAVQRHGLHLRRWTDDDVDVLHLLIARNVEHLRPFMAWASSEPLALAERRDLVQRWSEQWAGGGDVAMGIWWGGAAVGASGLRRSGENGLEIGYWVDRDHLRQGIATATSRLLTDLAFTVPGVERVRICHDVANTTSARVPSALGFVRLEDRPSDSAPAPAATGVDAVWQVSRTAWLTSPRP